MAKNNQTEKLIEYFSRTTDKYFSSDEFRKKLESGKKLTVKYGVDVTAPFLHLGHAVNLWLMRKLQEAGHKVVFLVGDFTTKIGDPTGRSEVRPIIDDEEIKKNTGEFIKQISSVLITNKPDLFEVRKNSEWYSDFDLDKFLSLLSMVTHSHLIARDMFQKRIRENREIYMHELIYPLLQGYDSVMLKSDVTIVGTDQLFNELMGRFFQEKFSQEPQVIITTKITPGLDGGQKQSKSLGNCVALTDSARDKFGKVMSLSDDLIIQWMEVYTEIDLGEIELSRQQLIEGKINPRDLKLELAAAIVARYADQEVASREKNWFLETFSSDKFPDDAPMIMLATEESDLMEVLKECLPQQSNSGLMRLIKQGGVELDGEKILDPQFKIKIGSTSSQLRLGKKNFFRLMSE